MVKEYTIGEYKIVSNKNLDLTGAEKIKAKEGKYLYLVVRIGKAHYTLVCTKNGEKYILGNYSYMERKFFE
ncbi:MAG: hypothetical protein INQ03_10355 [Candidatus Heimdallarchaeota archaeon]|nr:hypothetical protein [Candidatus Heimdallarchaeota archaeon]